VRMTNPEMLEFKITFGVGHEQAGGSVRQLDSFAGLSRDDLEKLADGSGARLHTRPGSVGVGAAGPGVELVLAYASIPGDFVSLVAAGQMIRSIVKKVQDRRRRTVTISDSNTMAAVAAASLKSELGDQLRGARLKSVRNLFGGEPPNWLGTDTRHVWAVTFEHVTDGYVFIILMSPSGLVLGHVTVPLESYWDGSSYQQRTAQDIASFGHFEP